MYILTKTSEDGCQMLINTNNIVQYEMDDDGDITVRTNDCTYYTIGNYNREQQKAVFDQLINFLRTGYGTDIFQMP
jgi:hypothetical protein